MKEFKAAVVEYLPDTQSGLHFDKGVPVEITIKLYTGRPNNDFKGSKREWGRLKRMLSLFCPICPDIDNLAKFGIDGLNGLICFDDSQVIKLVTYKLLNSEGECEGRTLVQVREYRTSDDIDVYCG